MVCIRCSFAVCVNAAGHLSTELITVNVFLTDSLEKAFAMLVTGLAVEAQCDTPVIFSGL